MKRWIVVCAIWTKANNYRHSYCLILEDFEARSKNHIRKIIKERYTSSSEYIKFSHAYEIREFIYV
jgi:hypothetical protein